MSRIKALFEKLAQENRTALMPYLCMGYPELDSTLTLVPALVEGGADLIELGVPFSDPLADGATIQAAGQQALANGMTLSCCLDQAAELRSRWVEVPFVLMGYYNPIYSRGVDRFLADAKEAGIEITGFARTYAGVDATQLPIPVQPTCHYMMGGIATDYEGRVIVDEKNTPYSGLYAAGECACVSVHGANRLGCNALLDTLVFGRRAGRQIKKFVQSVARPKLPAKPDKKDADIIKALMKSSGRETSGAIRAELQQSMMENVSVFRQHESLMAALDTIKTLKARYKSISIQDKGSCFNRDLLDAIELGHLLDLAEAITHSALAREESRGAHSREDFPDRDDDNWLKHSLAYLNGDSVRIEYKKVDTSVWEPKPRTY